MPLPSLAQAAAGVCGACRGGAYAAVGCVCLTVGCPGLSGVRSLILGRSGGFQEHRVFPSGSNPRERAWWGGSSPPSLTVPVGVFVSSRARMAQARGFFVGSLLSGCPTGRGSSSAGRPAEPAPRGQPQHGEATLDRGSRVAAPCAACSTAGRRTPRCRLGGFGAGVRPCRAPPFRHAHPPLLASPVAVSLAPPVGCPSAVRER